MGDGRLRVKTALGGFLSGEKRQGNRGTARAKDAQNPCQDTVVANSQEDARLKEVKRRGKKPPKLPKESEEALFRDIIMEKELREARKDLLASQAGMEKDLSQRAQGDGCCGRWCHLEVVSPGARDPSHTSSGSALASGFRLGTTAP